MIIFRSLSLAANPAAPTADSRKGTNGVSTNGVTATCMFFDKRTFWVITPGNPLLASQKCQGVPFSPI